MNSPLPSPVLLDKGEGCFVNGPLPPAGAESSHRSSPPGFFRHFGKPFYSAVTQTNHGSIATTNSLTVARQVQTVDHRHRLQECLTRLNKR